MMCKWFGACEATWRLFQFPMRDMRPSVLPLAMHLEGGQRVVFNTANPVAALSDRNRRSTLTAYFETKDRELYEVHRCAEKQMIAARIHLNALPVECLGHAYKFVSSVLYHQYPRYFKWVTTGKYWQLRKRTLLALRNSLQPRKNQRQLGRVYSVSPRQLECYYLRLLLHDERMASAATFDQMLQTRTGDGSSAAHTSYEATAIALGICQDDSVWLDCMDKAQVTAGGYLLRRLFVVILIHAHPADALALWVHSKSMMSEDIAYRNIHLPEEKHHQLCLAKLATLLESQGKKLQDFHLPAAAASDMVSSRLVDNELSYDNGALQNILSQPLLPHQQVAFDDYLQSYSSNKPLALFLDAVAGAGKTKFLNHVLAQVRSDGNVALAVATSGIAALLLMGGRTPNSRFKAGIRLNDQSVCDVSRQASNPLVQLLRAVKVIVWDEAPMANRLLMETIHRTLCDIRGTDPISGPLFGGVILIMAGDFRQNLPVVRRGSRSQVVAASLKSSYLWKQFKIVEWRTNIRSLLRRSDTDTEHFAAYIESIGNGQAAVDTNGLIKLPHRLSFQGEQLEDLIQHVYAKLAALHTAVGDAWAHKPAPSMLTNFSNYLAQRAILAPTNKATSEINSKVLDLIPGAKTVFRSCDSVNDESDRLAFPIEFLNGLTINGMPEHRLELKVGCTVMLLRNLDPDHGDCNGSRYVVIEIHANTIVVRNITGKFTGEISYIPKCKIIDDSDTFPFQLVRVQFPLRVCYAMTINKSQGQTLSQVAVYLPQPCFAHGQLYTAMSRVGTWDDIVIMCDESKRLPDGCYLTANIVYQDVLG